MEKNKRSTKRDIRSIATNFKTRDTEGPPIISGYFVVFDSKYDLWDGAFETVDKHAFDKTLENDIRCLTNHVNHLVLGRTTAKTLTLKVDEVGLYGEVMINEHDTDAMNVYERVKRGDVNQCSFGFEILDEEYREENGKTHWHIKEVNLQEVSVVTFPAYEETSVSARNKEYETLKKRSLEQRKKMLMSKIKGE